MLSANEVSMQHMMTITLRTGRNIDGCVVLYRVALEGLNPARREFGTCCEMEKFTYEQVSGPMIEDGSIIHRSGSNLEMSKRSHTLRPDIHLS